MAEDETGRLLRAALDEGPDDDSRYLVYADWLQRRGDPHGELIALQMRLRHDRSLQPAIDALMARHRERWLGPFADKTWDRLIELRWRRGFIRGARLIKDHAAGLVHLRAHPLACYLDEIVTCSVGLEIDESTELRLVRALAADPLPHLTQLSFGPPTQGYDSSRWYCGCDLSELWPGASRIRRFSCDGGLYALGDIRLPAATAIEFRCGALQTGNAQAIATAVMPHVERLIIAGDHGTGVETLYVRDGRTTVSRCDGTLADLAPLFARTDLPRLRHLGIQHCLFFDDLCAVLPRSPLVRRLESLDLSSGFMTDAAAELLCRGRDQLRHLTWIDVSFNVLSVDAIRALAQIGPEIRSVRQSPDVRHG